MLVTVQDETMFREGPFLASGGRDKRIILWDAGTGVAIHTFVSAVFCSACRDIAYFYV